MYLNTLSPGEGAKTKPKRLGRGIGSGLGKTCGKGHKGQKARAGGYHKVGFEGGQMPLQRRLPKFGFTSRKALDAAEVRLGDLNSISAELINLESLLAAKLIAPHIRRVKVILRGEANRAFKLAGVKATKGAKLAIEAAGGRVE